MRPAAKETSENGDAKPIGISVTKGMMNKLVKWRINFSVFTARLYKDALRVNISFNHALHTRKSIDACLRSLAAFGVVCSMLLNSSQTYSEPVR